MIRAFVIAMEDEADCIRPFLKGDDRLLVSGIGKVNAAAAAMRAICDGAGQIVNVGFCGGFGEGMCIGDVYGVREAVEYDFDLAEINGTAIGVLNEYDTPFLACQCAPELERYAWFCGWRVLATGDHFNDGEDDYGLITDDLGASLRDMEGAAIAHVCKRERVPCLLLKCVTNVVGKGSMTGQFTDNRKFCSERLKSAMEEWM